MIELETESERKRRLISKLNALSITEALQVEGLVRK